MELPDYIICILLSFVIISTIFYFTIEEKNIDLNKEIKDFELIGKRFSENHMYINNTYNCVNYSNDFKEITDELGFKTRKTIGCTNSSGNISCHQFLELIFEYEPAHGEFVDYSEKYPIRRNFRVE